ncbi:MAG TPA: ribosome recycling factor [Euzebyales bacterium]|nr:ribosome recycling factor [Euzebyales bacterium]
MTEAELKMSDSVDHTRGEFAKIRTGRANPGLITELPVDYYGTRTPLQQIAGVSVPEPRMLLVNPYDANALRNIERAIQSADLGVNPSNDGSVIRVVFPELSEERRKDFVRLARERAEEGRVAIRNIRRSAKSDFEALEKGGEISEDELRRAEQRLQELTNTYVANIDELLANKERELLEV